jgi:hypothetical protein
MATANMQTYKGLVETPVECFVDIQGIKCFVRKSHETGLYVVSEYSSGFAFHSFGETVENAIKKARKKIEEIGKAVFLEKVMTAIAKHGIANG